MKKLFLLVSLLYSNIVFSQIVSVTNNFYSITYDIKKEQPLIASYIVNSKDCGIKRDGLDFYRNDTIHTSDDKDYEYNVWDKGHLVPAANFRCDKSGMVSSFSYLNCSLQHQDLNRKTWMYLENFERKIADTCNSVRVVVKLLFSDNSKVLSTGATVPDFFIKEIYIRNKLYGVWKFPNTKPISTDPNYYRVQ